MEKFDGDYDVLYSKFASKHKGFQQEMERHISVNNVDAATSVTMATVLQETPELNVAIPVNIDKWNASAQAPLVTFIPAGFDERKTKQLKAFDKDGKVHWLDAQKAPDFPVVVVGASERVRINPSSKEPEVIINRIPPYCEDPNNPYSYPNSFSRTLPG